MMHLGFGFQFIGVAARFFFAAALFSRLALFTSFLFFLEAGLASSSENVTWEQQAERLQNVSATLLDDVPLSVVPASGLALTVGAGVSLLPEVSPKVGSKSEKVPSSPIHAVPKLQLSYGLDLALARVAGRGWVGYLPAGLEGLLGIKAELTQFTAGFALASGMALGLPPFIGGAAVEIGYQMTSASLRGAITESDAKDEFDSSTQILFGSFGLHPTTLGLHAAVLVASKITKSKFVVSSSRTELELTDHLDDSDVPVVMQGQIGFRFPPGVTLGLAEIWVPERLLMPRLFGQFEYAL